MVFNSHVFVLLFLPASVIGWFLLNKLKSQIFAKVFLVAMSFVFYGYFNVYYVFLFAISIFVNFILSHAIIKAKNAQNTRQNTGGGISEE